jgi:long-chain acyl-CoA synthetase
MVIFSSLTIKHVLSQARILHAVKPSLGFVGQKPLTYDELSILVSNTSSLLLTLGISKGDRVAILGENSPNWCIAYLAVTCMGAVAVPISCEYSSNDVTSILNHCQAKAIFISAKQFSKKFIGEDQKSIDVLLLNNLQVQELKGSNIDKSLPYSLPEPRVNVDFSNFEIPEPMEEDLASIVYKPFSSYERPVGVMLTHKNIISNCLSTYNIHEVKSTDRLLSILPLSQTYECSIGFILPLMRGGSVTFLQKRPTISLLESAFQIVKPTIILLVPQIVEKIFISRILPKITSSKFKAKYYCKPVFRKIFHRLASQELHNFFGNELHFMGIGGANLSPKVERFLYEASFPYSIGYGITEASTLLTGSSPANVKFGCVGVALPGQEMLIHNPCEHTGAGEVWVRGANIMLGYYKEEKLTNEVITEDGWLRTGDIGFIHPNGFLELRGKVNPNIANDLNQNAVSEVNCLKQITLAV